MKEKEHGKTTDLMDGEEKQEKMGKFMRVNL